VYDAIPNMTMADLKAFHEQYIKDSKYNIMVIGKKSGLNIKELETYGPVTYLTLEQVFGY
jgi:predicted Zn-dependent peptidase